MPIEIRELIVKAILDNDGEKEATERAIEQMLPEEFRESEPKKEKSKEEIAADRAMRSGLGQKLPEGDLSWEEEEEEEGEDEFMDSKESIIQECMDRVKQYLEDQLMR
jgi:hypothetical protein